MAVKHYQRVDISDLTQWADDHGLLDDLNKHTKWKLVSKGYKCVKGDIKAWLLSHRKPHINLCIDHDVNFALDCIGRQLFGDEWKV